MKKQKIILICAAVFAALICVILIFDAENIIEASKRSVFVCLSSIIPSLFAFMVFSQLIISSGIADVLFTPLYKISSFWFKGDRRLFSIFMLSLIGGYPVGVKLLKEYIAYNKNYNEIVENMLCFCYCGSPAFIIQIAGLAVFGSSAVGAVIYLSNVTACIIGAVLINIFSSKSKKIIKCENIKPAKSKVSLQSVIYCISSSVKALGIICGAIIAFNILIEIIDFCGLMNFFKGFGAEKIISAALEISNLSLLNENGRASLLLCSALTSFGGVCILFQTAALAEGKIKLKKFILARIPIAFTSALCCGIYAHIFGISVEASSSAMVVPAVSSVNPICSVCIIVMSYLLMKKQNIQAD